MRVQSYLVESQKLNVYLIRPIMRNNKTGYFLTHTINGLILKIYL